jgi:hypothetical protein
MAIVVGRHMPQSERVSIAHRKSVRQIEFGSPADFLRYVGERGDLNDEILAGDWDWTTQPVQGGH